MSDTSNKIMTVAEFKDYLADRLNQPLFNPNPSFFEKAHFLIEVEKDLENMIKSGQLSKYEIHIESDVLFEITVEVKSSYPVIEHINLRCVNY